MRDMVVQVFISICLLLVCFSGGCKKGAVLRYTQTRPATAQTCAGCHEEIYQEWQNSPHAHAWTSKKFMESLSDTGTVACWPCHAPAVLVPLRLKEPPLRETNLMEGVNCAACHGDRCPYIFIEAAEEDYTKPGGAAVSEVSEAPTEISKLPPQITGEKAHHLCGICHRNTYKQWLSYMQGPYWDSIESPPTCITCHLTAEPEWVRSISGFRPMRSGAYGKDRDRIDHSIAMIWKQAIAIEVLELHPKPPRGFEADILLHNRMAGHPLPSAHYGYREIRLEGWLGDYAPEAVRSERFFVEMGTALQPGPNGPFRMTFNVRGSKLTLRVVRLTGLEEDPFTIDKQVIDVAERWPEMIDRSESR